MTLTEEMRVLLTGMRSILAAHRVLMRGSLARYAVRGVSEVSQFESELCATTGAQHALGVNSGTSALVCALVGAGIGPGDEVLVPAYTWVSSAAAAIAVGAVPVLVEIDHSLTMDPADLARKITPHSKAVIPVHMLNLVCDMDSIMRIADDHELIVVEDASQAVGVTWRSRRVGSIGHAGAFSFQQNKNIQSGEGGALLTSDLRIDDRARMYHDVGSYIRENHRPSSEPPLVGVNYRMSELTAAILRPQLRALDRKLERMRARRNYVLDRLTRSRSFSPQVCPHHDASSAVGLAVYFDDAETARAFATVRGIRRLIDTGRHIYTNWLSIRGKRPTHPALDPHAWAHRSVDLGPDSCPRTLEILKRTCAVHLAPEMPTVAYRVAVRRMVR